MSEPTEVFKYHPITGNPLKTKAANFLIDEKTGKKYFIDPKPTTHAILLNPKGEIVFVVRGRKPHKGKLNLPAGFLDIEETFEEAIKREVTEELGIKIKNLKYHGSFVNRYLFGGVNNYIIDVGFISTIDSDQVKRITPSDDAIGVEFYKKNEIPFKRIAFKSINQSLKKYINI